MSGAASRNAGSGPSPRSSTVPTSTSSRPVGNALVTIVAVALLTTISPPLAVPRIRATRFTAGPK
jgi:hypothetical protein